MIERKTSRLPQVARLLAALLLTESGGCEPTPSPADAATALGAFQPLAPFFHALNELERGRAHRVAVLQIGDSHTANDAFSGRMRDLMQARFGDAGRGVLPPGIPYQYYRPAQVRVTATGWDVARSSGKSPAPGPFGFAGLRQTATGPASMTLAADPPGLQRITVEALGQPGGGGVTVTSRDGDIVRVSTQSARREIITIPAAPGAGAAEVTVSADGDGPVDLLGWTAERAAPGVTWSNLGTVGATVDLVLQWDPAFMAVEARAQQPTLLLLAFGTNEGFRDATDLALYREQVAAVLRVLQRSAPGAAIAVMGPPGGVRAAGAGQGVPCPDRRFAIPANLAPVRAILHQAASSAGLFFWDWAAAMGGDCAMAEWAARDPPWAASDHVHLLQPGARATAEALFAALMTGYERYGRMAR